MFTLRILVAENNRPSLNLYRDILTKMGHDVDIATQGDAAWDIFCHQPYHAVLIDLKLPVVDGEEFYRRVKEIAPDVDVILLTGNSSIDRIMQLVELGAVDYLVKPVNPRRLREMFDRVAIKQKLLADGSSLVDELGELPSLDPPPEVEREHPPAASESSVPLEADHASPLDRVPDTSNERIAYLEGTIARLEEDLESLEDQLTRRTQELEDLEKSRQRMKEALQRERDRMSSKDAEMTRLEETVHQLTVQLDAVRSAEESNRRLIDEVSRLQDELLREQEISAKTSAHVEELEKRLSRARSESDASSEAAERIAELEEEKVAFTKAAAAREEALSYLKRKYEARNEKFKALKDAARVLEGELARAEGNLVARDRELSGLQDDIQAKDRRLLHLKREVEQRDQTIDRLESSIAERDSELSRVQSEALQSGEELARSVEVRMNSQILALRSEVESLKSTLALKEETILEAEEKVRTLREAQDASRVAASERIAVLESELAELREVLAERETILREAQAKREEELREELRQREAELQEAREGGRSEHERIEQELQELRKLQRQRELQSEYQSEWMELGEALVLLDEEVKTKEVELKELQENMARTERAYETTIANQRRKYHELEENYQRLCQDKASGEDAPTFSADLTGEESAQIVINGDGLILSFNDRLRRLLAIDDSRRPGQTFVEEIVSAKQLRPIILRITEGMDEVIERPLYVRPPGAEPRPFWGIAVRKGEVGAEMFTIDLFDLSERTDLLVGADFADARIAFDGIDGVYRRALKIKEALASVRIIFDILNRKFKDDVEIRTMVADALKEFGAVNRLVDDI